MKKLLIALLTIIMVLSIGGGLVACNIKPIDITVGDWGPNSTDDPEDAYVVTKGANGGIEIQCDSVGNWMGTRNVLNVDAKTYAKVNVLMFTASADTDNLYVMFKFEFNGGAPAVEVPVVLTTTATTYRVDLTNIDMTKVFRVLIFVDPLNGAKNCNAKLTIPSMYLTDKDATANVTELHADVAMAGVPNAITSSDRFIRNWYDRMSGKVYTVTESQGVYTVNYTKKYDTSYYGLQALVTGDMTSFKTFRITLKGTAGETVLVKPFNANAFEQLVTFDGTEQEIVIDITKADVDATQPIIIIAAPGSDVGTGTFQILSTELSTEAAPVVEDPKLNTITDDNKTFGKWFDGGDSVYTVSEASGVYTINYNKTAHEYASVQAKLGGDLDNIVAVKFVVKGTAGKSALFKPFDNFEQRVEFTGEEQTVEITVTGYNKANPIIIMAEGGTAAAEGSFQIIRAEVVKANPNLNTITADNTKVTKWYGEAVYTITDGENGSVNVSKSEKGWQQLKADVTGADLANMASFKIVVSGVLNKDIIVKPYDKVEAKYEPSSEDELTITIDLTGVTDVDYTQTNSILIFFEYADDDAAASFVIKSAEFIPATTQE